VVNEIAAVVYGILAGGCFAAALAEVRMRQATQAPAYPSLWALLTAALLLLAAQRLTGDISQITDHFRQQAYAEGWYAERRDLQWAIIMAIPPIAVALLVGLSFWARHAGKRLLLPVATLVYLTGFSLVLLVSLHHIDWVMRQQVGPLKVQGWCYAVGAALTALSLRFGVARPPRTRGAAAEARREQERGRRGANV
jgi:hypothetical protein